MDDVTYSTIIKTKWPSGRHTTYGLIDWPYNNSTNFNKATNYLYSCGR